MAARTGEDDYDDDQFESSLIQAQYKGEAEDSNQELNYEDDAFEQDDGEIKKLLVESQHAKALE